MKPSFFKKSNESFETPKVEENTEENIVKEVVRKKDTVLMDKKITEYVINNFPSMSLEIKDSLNNLTETLEKTIDFIEDTSRDVVKNDRDFELSQSHRNTSIAIYNFVKDINEYIRWMDDTLEESQKKNNEEVSDVDEEIDIKKDDLDKELDEELGDGMTIAKDFTGKEPKAFKLDEYFVKVYGWDDLIVKATDLLVKHFKESKESLKVVYQDMKISHKKSPQNTMRDSVIEILNEYNIYLNDFVVFIK